jgi:drug/metabolite transporter (DMT)-like permease
MPSALTAILSAIAYGVADFLGGLGSRRATALPVTALSQVMGALTLALVVPLLSNAPPETRGLVWGALAGVAGATFLMLFYYLLANGRMGIVAPVSAVWAIIVPVAAGLLIGERPGAIVAVGILLAIIATVMMSGGDTGARSAMSTSRMVWLSVLAGAGGGCYFILIQRAGPASGLWPVLAARITSTVVTAGVLLASRSRGVNARPLTASSTWPALVSGVLDVGGSALYVIALRHELMTVTVTLVSLYPAITVFLAWLVLHERFRLRHALGMGLAGMAIILIAAS